MAKKSKVDDWINSRRELKKSLNADLLFEELTNGNRVSLGKAITLIESERPQDKNEANKLIRACLALKKKSWRIGITGVPGVGKSTFIEALGSLLIESGKKVAVLAVDPSSSVSGGSILGDKTRMEKLSSNDNVFVRPSPSGLTLGGIAKHTRETIFLCEAAGYDIILIETVGVGQSETLVHSMVDMFALLHLAGAGDELQGVKRGIMELADVVAITKVEDNNKMNAKVAKSNLSNALHLFPQKENNCIVKVILTSALENVGIEDFWNNVVAYFESILRSGWYELNRKNQEITTFQNHLKELSSNYFSDNIENYTSMLSEIENQIEIGEMSGYLAAEEFFLKISNKKRE